MKTIVELTRECEALSLDDLIKRRGELISTIEFLKRKRRFGARAEQLQDELDFVVGPLITQKTPRGCVAAL